MKQMNMRKIEKVPHPLIEEWAKKHFELERAMRTAIEKLKDDELQALKHAASSLTSINCWFAEYDAKEMIEPLIMMEEQSRAYKRQSAAGDEQGEKK